MLCWGWQFFCLDRVESRRFRDQSRQSVLQELNTVRTLLEGQLYSHWVLADALGRQALAESPHPSRSWSALRGQLQQNYPAIEEIVWKPRSTAAEVDSAVPLAPQTESSSSLGRIQLQVPIQLAGPEANTPDVGEVHLIVDLDRLVRDSPLAERVL